MEADRERGECDVVAGRWKRLGREERDQAGRREEVRLGSCFQGGVVKTATVYTKEAVGLG